MAERSPVTRLLLRTILNFALVWILATQLDQYFILTGGWWGILVVGSLVTLLNFLVRPLLQLIALPFRLFASLLATLMVNVIFVWLLVLVAHMATPPLFQIRGITGWIVVAVVLGLGNWVMKMVLK